MVRVGARGSGEFRRVGWPVAYQTIAEGLARIRSQYGPEAVALFYHGKGGAFFLRLLGAFGSPNYAAPSDAQCKGPRNVGYYLTFGEKLPSPEPLDLAEARAILLVGSHLGENAHNSQMQDLVEGLRRGAKLVTVDPRFSTAASKSEHWLAIEPGTDLALLLAWIRLLLVNGTYHRPFVDNQCAGLETLREQVRDCTPAWAAGLTGLPERQIEQVYRLFVESMPRVVVHPGRHVTWYGDDTQRSRAMAILTALLGAWWTRGGMLRTSAPVLADYPGPEYPETKPDVDRAAGRYPFALEVTTTGLRDATRSGKPYPVKGWLVYGTNLLQSLPAQAETLEAIDKLDLLVACDVMPTEITRYADVLLPEDTYLERYDDLAAGNGEKPYVGLRAPVVRSPHDTRPAWRIARELAQAMGLGEYFGYGNAREYLQGRLAGTGVSLAELEREGIVFVESKVEPVLDPAAPHRWKTPSGKVELASERLAKAGFDAVPVYRPHPKPPAGTFRLLYGRSPLHSFSRTQNNSILAGLEPDNLLWMNPADATTAGLADGGQMMVASLQGRSTGPVRLKLTERMPPGSVYLIHGFGSQAPWLRRAYGRGASDAVLMDSYTVDPICGATGMRGSFVKVAPFSGEAKA
jgi:thiosulfate reductase/polysulfide reductase chain A